MPLPTNVDDWTTASETEQHTITPPNLWPTFAEMQQPQPQLQAVDSQNWSGMAGAADTATAIVLRQRQAMETDFHMSLPLRPLGIVEVVEEKQPLSTKPRRSASAVGLRQPSFTVRTQQPITTIEATKPQMLIAPDVPHTVTKDQIMVVSFPILLIDQCSHISQARRLSVSSITSEPKQIDVVVRDGAKSDQPPTLKQKSSFRKTIRRTRNKLSSAVLAALRVGSAATEQSSADRMLTEWKALVSEHEQEEMTMEGVYNPFQDMIEEAMDSKYQELMGGGTFLIHKESVKLPAELPVELAAKQKESTRPTEEEYTWLTHLR